MLQSWKKDCDALTNEWIENLLEKIKEHIETRKYRVTEHAMERLHSRSLLLPHILDVLQRGFHEKEKTLFNNKCQAWNYAIRGRTVNGVDVRVVVAFEGDMIIITVVRLPRNKR